MTELIPRQQQALAPLIDALLARAHAEADQLRAAAEAVGRQSLAEARDDVAALLAMARARGEADGAARLAAEQARSRGATRTRLLEAQQAIYEQLRHNAGQTVRELLQAPGNRRRLADALVHRLGGRATVSDTDDGGLLAQTPDGRSVDASIVALVDGALADLDLEQVWTPR